MFSILEYHARTKYCQWKYQEWKEEESISKGWIEYLFCKKGSGNPSRWKLYVNLFSTQNQQCSFLIIVVIIMNSIKTSMLILKERLANHSNQDQSRLSPHLPLTKPIKLTKASLEKDCCRTSFLRFPLFTNSCYIYISMLVQIQSIFWDKYPSHSHLLCFNSKL